MRRRMRYSFVIIKVAEYDIKDMFLLIFLTAIAHNANCEIDVFESVQNRQFVTPQKMPTIYRNLLFLKEDCGGDCLNCARRTRRTRRTRRMEKCKNSNFWKFFNHYQ